VKEILLAALGVLGVAIPSVIQLMTGESRRVSNMRATLELMEAVPADDEELQRMRDMLKRSLAREARIDKDSSNHLEFLVGGSVIIVACLVCSYFVMQTPGHGQEQDRLHSLFILLALVLYVVGAAVLVHGAHLLGRNLHLFSKSEPAEGGAAQ
jgi:hypothetical protein